jgi:hypothetical protein
MFFYVSAGHIAGIIRIGFIYHFERGGGDYAHRYGQAARDRAGYVDFGAFGNPAEPV